MVTRKEVAECAGVSTMTVTRVITGRGYISEETREKVREAIDRLGYIPNEGAATLVRGGNSKVIAVLIPELMNLYYFQIVDHLSHCLAEQGYSLLLKKVTGENGNEVLKEVIAGRVSGILNMSYFSFDRELLGLVDKYGIRSVLMGENSCNITVDYAEAIREAFEIARQKGVKTVAFFTGRPFVGGKREKTVKECCSVFGMEYREDDAFVTDYPLTDSFKAGYRNMLRFLEKGGEADLVFCLNDTMARGVIKAIENRNPAVNRDISVIGFDNTDLGIYAHPTLTSIGLDLQYQSEQYVKALLGSRKNASETIKARLNRRESF